MGRIAGAREGEAAAEGGYKTVDKALQLLTAFTRERPELGVGEIAAHLGMHKSIVSRLAKTLRDWRMLEQNPETRQFRIGVGAFRLGMLFASRLPVHAVALPFLGDLVAETRQTAHVSVRDGLSTLVVASVESPKALRVIMRLADRRELHATAAGKLMLAYMPGLLEEVLAKGALEGLTPNTITSESDLRSALDRARRARLAWNDGESTIGAGAVAAPIFSSDGMVAALSSVYPLATLSEDERGSISAAVARAAQKISDALRH